MLIILGALDIIRKPGLAGQREERGCCVGQCQHHPHHRGDQDGDGGDQDGGDGDGGGFGQHEDYPGGGEGGRAGEGGKVNEGAKLQNAKKHFG